ncbi:MAG: 50S ribosomal protein L9 [Cryomorphaceae bacterium]|jgi:large subunit ribosomal protein L9|nr:50S ribosomal protein L9 [Cryomorphaceae bacterium]
MEIILKTDVENLGFKDDIVTVKHGYARNFLIPQGMAQLATDSARKVLAENLKQRAHKEKKVIEDASKLMENLKKAELKIASKVGAGNKLFGSINNQNVSEALAELGHQVDKKCIQIPGNTIKSLGTYTAKVRLHRDVAFDIEFDVVSTKK